MGNEQLGHSPFEEAYPLSPMQQGMLFHSLYDGRSGVDVVQLVGALQERLDAAAFGDAWGRLIDRHAVLRTSFAWKGLEEPRQRVHSNVPFRFERRDWRGRDRDEQDEGLAAYLAADRQEGLQLSQAPLMRAALFELADDAHRLVWSFHQTLLDSHSLSTVLHELFAGYDALRTGRELRLEAPVSFRTFVEWVRGRDWSRAEAFWRETLRGFTTPTPLIALRPTPDRGGEEGYEERQVELDTRLAGEVRSLMRRHGITARTVIAGAWALLLGRYSGENDVLFGVTWPGRPATLPEAESIVGLLVNTLPARVLLAPAMPVAAWLQELQLQQEAVQEHEHTPLVDIQRWSEIARGVPLFESLIVFEHPGWSSEWRARGGVDLCLIQRTNYALTLIADTEPELSLKLVYDRRRLQADTVARMSGHLRMLLQGMAEGPERPLASLPLLTEPERRRMLVDWNASARALPPGACVHRLIEAQAARTPEAVAVRFEGERWTYRRLDRRANQVAHQLRGLGVGPDTRVAVCVERSPDMVAGLLGVLKAGGCYVPLDPAYPKERLAFMVEDSSVAVLVTQKTLLESLPAGGRRVLLIDDEAGAAAAEGREAPSAAVAGDDLAYVIYTSGSTGRPKGVQVPHRALVNLLLSMSERPGIERDDVWLAITTLSFDIAALELYLPLVSGACIELASRDTASDGRRLLEALQRSGATIMQATPATWRMLLDAGWTGDRRLRVLCGGESLPPELARELLARSREVWNMYGPTETTVWSTVHKVQPGETVVSIGRPIANTEIYLLDANLQPVPIGVAGELHIGGAGLARGYLNRPELTADRFVPDPFARGAAARLYRTGDLARYLPEGDVECLGRLDRQVKIRGFRIEPGEIEGRLLAHDGVRRAVVAARDDAPGGKQLVAYVVPEAERPPAAEVLRGWLKDQLPVHMIPAFIIFLDELPLTPNGKIDHRALPPPRPPAREAAKTGDLPRDSLEIQLAKIWERVLGIKPVGVEDGFFELGGDSLRAVSLFVSIEAAFGRSLPLATLFRAPTIRQLAGVLRQEGWSAPWSPLVAIQPEGSRPPFFCVHGVGGNVLNYRGLARHLGPDQPFYGIQARGLDGEQTPLTRIEDMAALYLQEVRALRPEGPYFLGGASFGGNVAFEMARQLQAEGHEVALVCLFDTYPAGFARLLPQAAGEESAAGLARRMKAHLRVLWRGPDRMAYLRKKARRVMRRSLYRTWQLLYAASRYLRRPLPAALQNVQQANYKALRDYAPSPYPGRVTYFSALREPEEFALEKQRGWAVLAGGGVDVHEVPGDHLTMVEEPNVKTLAEELKGCIHACRG